MTDPMIPLKYAERIFVALSVVVQELNKQSDYPTENLELILGEYETDRTKYLNGKGWENVIIKGFTSTAVADLQKWLNERAEKSAEAKSHLALWEAELGDLTQTD